MAQVGLLEDNTRIAKLCATMLQFAGHQVTIYEHPLECLRALQAPKLKYENRIVAHPARGVLDTWSLPIDALILDLHLPDIEGIEVLQYLRSQPHTRFLPLIFCTAASATEVAHAMSLAPHAAYVEKPFKLEALTSAITKAMNAHIVT
jgi:CheY-like chemotaxis protein